MAKFIFKLQTLLNIKLQLEEKLKNELGKAVQKLEYEKGVLKTIEIERDHCIEKVNGESGRGVTVGKLREYSSYIVYLKEKMTVQSEKIYFAQLEVDKCRDELIKMVQEREMLEKLKEKKHKEHLMEQSKEEQRLNDEIVSYKISRGNL